MDGGGRGGGVSLTACFKRNSFNPSIPHSVLAPRSRSRTPPPASLPLRRRSPSPRGRSRSRTPVFNGSGTPALDAPETRILVRRHLIVVRKAMRNPVLVLHLPSGDVRAPAHICHLRHDDAVSVLHPSALRVGSVPRPADDPLLVVAEEIVTIIVGALHREDGPLLAPDRVLYDSHHPDARQEAIVRVVAVHLHADVLRYQDLRGANVAPAVIFRLA